MSEIAHKAHGTQPPPATAKAATSASGHPLPRRTSPQNSVTLRHHRLARDATMKASPSRRVAIVAPASSPRRNSSNESHGTGRSDPKKWFDRSNDNAIAPFSQAMEVDPPFFQKETDSSNEDASKEVASYPFHLKPGVAATLRPTITHHSSSADDYRSVIDDLTVEIQRLKEELKRYKQLGPEMLKREKLFEIKVHGLPKRKKRELEATLREFAAGLDETPSADASSAKRMKSSKHVNRLYSASGSNSKHASSSSGSNSRPVDSAYASMSTGPNSSGTSLNRPSLTSRARTSEQKVENYLNDIPEGLYPRNMIMTDKEKQKLVVRRLEQLFTGKIGGTTVPLAFRASTSDQLAPVTADSAFGGGSSLHQPPSLLIEPAREARIFSQDPAHKKPRSRDTGSNSNSHGDQTESGGNGQPAGEGNNNSPPNNPPPEQRPTRLKDLDPDRAQVPSENMDYIRHLGLIPPELLPESKRIPPVTADADGWVYLNLLCNMAQLHMFNVTPDFIRSAVSEKSAKFQLSPDRRKIRWRGGEDGTKFSSDSSGDNSQRSPSTDDTDAPNDGQRKKQKTKPSSADDIDSAQSSKNPSKFGPQVSGSSASFHYKPLFVHQPSSAEQTSQDEEGSSFGPGEESNVGESRWGMSGSGSSQRRKRRLDGAIIYYSGAPFCTDLSGDPGDISPATHMAAHGQAHLAEETDRPQFIRPALPIRTSSGSLRRYRPLSDDNQTLMATLNTESETCPPGLTSDDTDMSDWEEADFPWSDSPQELRVHRMDPCGLGGVVPDDRFVVVVQTKRSKAEGLAAPPALRRLRSGEITDSIIDRLATMSTSSPRIRQSSLPRDPSLPVQIEYVSGRVKKLATAPLPAPAFFVQSSIGTSESPDGAFGSEADDDDDDDMETTAEFLSRRAAIVHQTNNTYPEDEDITSGDEEGGEPDDDDEPPLAVAADVAGPVGLDLQAGRDLLRRTSSSAIAAPGTLRGRSGSAELAPRTGSSVATAGGAVSNYGSMSDDE